jgi:hypothetical protein
VRFACDGCGKRYATAEPPAPGQVLRITCKACGHLVEIRAPVDGVVAATAIDTEPPLGEDAPETVVFADAPFVELFTDAGAGAPPAPARGPEAPADTRPRRATPAPRTTGPLEIPAAPPRRRPRSPLLFIGAGVAAVVATLAFVLLGGKAAQPTPAASARPTPTTPSAPTPTATPNPPPARREKPRPETARKKDATGVRDARERDRRRQASAASHPAILGPEQVDAVIAANRSAFDGCLAEARRTGEVALDGRRVVLRLDVQRTGAVTHPTLDDVTLSGTALGACLKGAARRIVFPRFQGGTLRVEVPLQLTAAL